MVSKEAWLKTMREKYGEAWFKEIGKRGGQATKDAAAARPQEFKDRGSQGGQANVRKHGTEHMRRIVTERHERDRKAKGK